MNICIVILYSKSWSDISNIVIPNVQKYAQKNGYSTQIICYGEPFTGFEKIVWAKSFLNDYDFIWSLDMDVLLTNMTKKVGDYLQEGKDFFICADVNGINAGSFIIRKSKWSRNFLNQLLQIKDRDGLVCEQKAIQAYMQEHPDDEKIHILAHPSINSYPYNFYAPSYGKMNYQQGDTIKKPTHEQGCWEYGDLVMHLPGMSPEKRIEVLTKTESLIKNV